MRATLVFKWHRGKSIPPRVRFLKRQRPQFFGGWIAIQRALFARFHINGVNALAIGGIGEANRKFLRVVLGLRHAFAHGFIPGLRFHYRQFVIAIDQYIVR